MSWNPRYSLYAACQGHSEEEQAAKDEILWPGGCMVGFSLWIHRAWEAYSKTRCTDHKWTTECVRWALAYQEDFDAWLARRTNTENQQFLES